MAQARSSPTLAPLTESMDWMVPLLFDKVDANEPAGGTSGSNPDQVDKCDLEVSVQDTHNPHENDVNAR